MDARRLRRAHGFAVYAPVRARDLAAGLVELPGAETLNEAVLNRV